MIHDLMKASVQREHVVVIGYAALRLDRYVEALEKKVEELAGPGVLTRVKGEHHAKYRGIEEFAAMAEESSNG
jgi:hypothetical protein